MLVKTLFLFVILIFTGCGVTNQQEIVFDKPQVQIPKAEPVPKKNKGSLYSMQGTSLFADKKDLQIGDIIQIIIDEDTAQKSNNKRELSRTSSTNLGGAVAANTGAGITKNIASTINNGLGLSVGTDSSNSDAGSVKTQVDETFSTTISAIIQETYQNGNYYIKGTKELLIEGQKQKIIVSGVIRPYDITSDNSINSSQIANLKLLYDKDGTESDILDTPWGTKILRALWPF